MTPTTSNRTVVDELVTKRGDQGPDEPRVIRIVQYTNTYGGISWGLVLESQPLDKYERELDATVYWDAGAAPEEADQGVLLPEPLSAAPGRPTGGNQLSRSTAREVPCPVCKAEAGTACVSATGLKARYSHAERK